MKVIVGLGNPGREYERTPHNVGFMALDELGERLLSSFRRSFRFNVRAAKANLGGTTLLLIKPQTYMNDSGRAVAAVLGYHRASPEDLLVVLDDADLEAGQMRIRKKGSSGGHRGLASIAQTLGTEQFVRIRLGIGRGPGEESLREHVLSPLSGEAYERLRAAAVRGADAVLDILAKGVDRAMNDYNARPEKSGPGQDEA